MKAARKTVSVIIPVFNGERTIAAAIDSALAQEFDGGIEVIVVNDGSTDATAEILRDFGDRIRVIDQPNGGPAGARNAAVRASHGEYLAFLDADDIWLPGKLRKTLAALDNESGRGAAMAYSDAWKIGAGGEPLGMTYTPETEKRAPAMEDMLSRLWNILPSTAVMRRATFEKIGGFCEDFATGHPQWEDGYFMILAREHGGFIYLDEPTVLYRVSASVAENLKRRRVWKSENAQAMRVERYVRNSDLMQRLVRERFGDRALRLIAAIRRTTVDLLAGAGLTAMLEDDRTLARRCYRLALHYGPFNPKTYLRIAWTYLPQPVARAISAVLPARIQRALSGPAQA